MKWVCIASRSNSTNGISTGALILGAASDDSHCTSGRRAASFFVDESLKKKRPDRPRLSNERSEWAASKFFYLLLATSYCRSVSEQPMLHISRRDVECTEGTGNVFANASLFLYLPPVTLDPSTICRTYGAGRHRHTQTVKEYFIPKNSIWNEMDAIASRSNFTNGISTDAQPFQGEAQNRF